MRRLLSSGAAAALGRVAGMGAQFACYALLARLLTPPDFGAYVFASSIAIPLSTLATIGLTRFAVRFVAEHLVTDNFAAAQRTLRLVLTCGVLTIGLAALTSYAIVHAFNLSQASKAPASPALVAMWVACLAAGQLFAETVRGFHEVMVSSFMLGQGGGLVASLVLAGTLLSYSGSAPDLTMALRATVLAHAVLAPLSFVWLAFISARNHCQLIGASRSAERSKERLSGQFTDVIGVSLPVMLAYACAFVVLQGDIWIAYLMLDDTSVALLGAARRLAVTAAVPCYLATLAVMPMIPDLRVRNQPQQLEQVLRTSAAGAALLSLFVLVPLLVYPAGVSQLVYGAFFKDAAHLLLIASVGSALFVAAGSSSTVLTLTGYQNVNLLIQLLSGVLLLAAGFAAAYFFGLTGLTVAGSVVVGLNSLLCMMAVRRCLGISAHPYLPWELSRHH